MAINREVMVSSRPNAVATVSRDVSVALVPPASTRAASAWLRVVIDRAQSLPYEPFCEYPTVPIVDQIPAAHLW